MSLSLLSLPPATRALTLTLFALSTLLLLLRLSLNPTDLRTIIGVSGGGADGDVTLAFPWLVLVPGKVGWYPWTLVVSGFIEGNIIEFVVSLLTLPLAGRYLERVWGQGEFIKFIIIVQLISSFITGFVMFFLGAVVVGPLDFFIYGQSFYGLMALQTAFLVAFTQLIPEHQVQIAGGLFKIRVKSLPMLYVTFSNITCLLGYNRTFLIQAGWLVSWFYLRFYKLNEHGERGDRSETFAFAGWFPPFIQPYIGKVAKIVFDLAVRLNIIRPWHDIESGVGGGSLSSSTIGTNPLSSSFGPGGTIPGGARAEAERRRALALKALDQRMATKPNPTPPPPVAVARAQSPSGVASSSNTVGGPGSTNGSPARTLANSSGVGSGSPVVARAGGGTAAGGSAFRAAGAGEGTTEREEGGEGVTEGGQHP